MRRLETLEEPSLDVLRYGLAAKAITSFERLFALTVHAFEALGARRISYHHMPPPGALDRQPLVRVMAWGYPEAWLKVYQDRRYIMIDPVTKRTLQGGRSLLWSEVIQQGGANAQEQAFIDGAVAVGIGEGLAVPVFGPHGRNGYVGLGTGSWHEGYTPRARVGLEIVAQLGHQRYCELLARQTLDPITLSDREHEILHWVSQGKSNAVIADILQLSANTVDTYTRRIFKKLNVSDRVTASLRGLALGLLDHPPASV